MPLDLEGPFRVWIGDQEITHQVRRITIGDDQAVPVQRGGRFALDLAEAEQNAMRAAVRPQLDQRCHTCNGDQGKLTTGLVCLECGTDYSSNPPTRAPRASTSRRWLIVGAHMDANTYARKNALPARSWVCGCRNHTIVQNMRGINAQRVTIVYLDRGPELNPAALDQLAMLATLGATVVDQRNGDV